MTASLYQPGSSKLHHLHPLTKLTFSLTALVVIFGGPGDWLAAAIPGLLAFLALLNAGLGKALWLAGARILTPFAVLLFLIHGLFNPYNQTFLLTFGMFRIGQEGLFYAGLILLRIAAALAASLLLVLSTNPAHLIQALEEAHLHAGLAYLLGSPLLLLPQIASRIQAIQAAQQSRGLETQGGLLQRTRSLFPLAAPLIFSALMDVEERSLALEVRGFSAPGPKTSLTRLPDTANQRIARRGMILLAVLLVAIRIWLRFYGNY